jgi:predicted transcriptional regulator
MDIQFILKDKFRLAVLEELSSGEMSSDRIAKRNHLPAPGVERAIRELRAEEVIGGTEAELYLTDTGKEMLKQIEDMDQTDPGIPDSKARSREPSKLSGEDSRKRRENQGT